MRFQAIQDYGIIGDMQTAALISKDGSLDFLCYPYFDSPSVFASLLDIKKGGFFKIYPDDNITTKKQFYIPDTNILVTQFFTNNGIVEITDFMPIEENSPPSIIRWVRSLKKDIKMKILCQPAPDYSRSKFTLEKQENEIIINSNQQQFFLKSNIDLKCKKSNHIEGNFTLSESEHAIFIFSGNSLKTDPDLNFIKLKYKKTHDFWKSWSKKLTYKGIWQSIVKRSALTLKLLSNNNYGSIIAAVTFSLPEKIKGKRNWDYRYVWVRDACFTINTFIRLGCKDEAKKFFKWLMDLCKYDNKPEPLQIMYRFNGEKVPLESELMGLSGYKESSPIRIGNDAVLQCQIDILGEVIQTFYFYDNEVEDLPDDMWEHVFHLTDWICENWEEKGNGIWEMRKKYDFLSSRIMSWLALDRASKMLEKSSKSKDSKQKISKWSKTKKLIINDVNENFWDKKINAFTQYKGSNNVDASTLLMPILGMIKFEDEKWESTYNRIINKLSTDFLLKRYHTDNNQNDGINESEGYFCICSFWLIEYLAKTGNLDKSKLYLEKMLNLTNNLYLYSEEVNDKGQQLGNFPQAFSHIGLINAILTIEENIEK